MFESDIWAESWKIHISHVLTFTCISYLVFHNCHSDEKCPPCTFLTQKWCMGNHEVTSCDSTICTILVEWLNYFFLVFCSNAATSPVICKTFLVAWHVTNSCRVKSTAADGSATGTSVWLRAAASSLAHCLVQTVATRAPLPAIKAAAVPAPPALPRYKSSCTSTLWNMGYSVQMVIVTSRLDSGEANTSFNAK